MPQPPPRITSEVPAAVPAGELPRAVFLRLVELVYCRGRDRAGEREYVASLGGGLRMLWGTYLLDNEVANGGLHQYFFNSSRYYTAEALDGLALLAASDHVILLREAIDAVLSRVGGGLAFNDPRWRERYAVAEVPALDALTDRYWQLPLLEPMQTTYIRQHPHQFITE